MKVIELKIKGYTKLTRNQTTPQRSSGEVEYSGNVEPVAEVGTYDPAHRKVEVSHDEDGDDVEAEDEAVELVVPDVHVDRVQLDVDGLQVGQDGDSQLESGE